MFQIMSLPNYDIDFILLCDCVFFKLIKLCTYLWQILFNIIKTKNYLYNVASYLLRE